MGRSVKGEGRVEDDGEKGEGHQGEGLYIEEGIQGRQHGVKNCGVLGKGGEALATYHRLPADRVHEAVDNACKRLCADFGATDDSRIAVHT